MGSLGLPDLAIAIASDKPANNTIEDFPPCFFPALHPADRRDELQEVRKIPVEIDFTLKGWKTFADADIGTESIFEAAWALALRCYVGTEEVCFGLLARGEEKVRPHLMEPDSTVVEILQRQRRQTISIDGGSGPVEPQYNTCIQFIEDDESTSKVRKAFHAIDSVFWCLL